MNIQDILRKYPAIGKDRLKLNQDLRMAIEAKLNADGCIQASIITGLPHSTEPKEKAYELMVNLFDHLEEISLELSNMAEYTKLQIRQLDNIQKSVDEAILFLTYEERRIIELRYWLYPEPRYNWNKVVMESFYSRAECFRNHSLALQKLKNQINMRLYDTLKAI